MASQHWAAGLLISVLAVGACSRSDEASTNAATTTTVDTATTAASTTSTAPIDPEAAWSALIGGMAPPHNVSVVGGATGTPVAMTAEEAAGVIWTFDGSTWSRAATIPTSLDVLPRSVAAIEVADLTGDGEDDFLLPLDANGFGGSVLTEHGGSWTAAVFDTPFGPTTEVADLQLDDGDLLGFFNDCDPTCVDGEITEVGWTYADHRFVESRFRIVRDRSFPPSPGDPCDPNSDGYDCIDPEGDGTFEYLVDGGDCMASGFGSLCTDLDGDGYAGYPDSG